VINYNRRYFLSKALAQIQGSVKIEKNFKVSKVQNANIEFGGKYCNKCKMKYHPDELVFAETV
jgi:hypothetical protein